MRRLIALSLLLGLAACGSEGMLKPPEGHRLPPAAYGATEPKNADELLEHILNFQAQSRDRVIAHPATGELAERR